MKIADQSRIPPSLALSLPSCNYIKGWRTGTFIPSAMRNFAPPLTPTPFIQADGGGMLDRYTAQSWLLSHHEPGRFAPPEDPPCWNRITSPAPLQKIRGTRALLRSRIRPPEYGGASLCRHISPKKRFLGCYLLCLYSVPEEHLVCYRFCSKKVPAKLRCF